MEKSKFIQIRVTPTEKRRWQEAAAQAGGTLSEAIRLVMNERLAGIPRAKIRGLTPETKTLVPDSRGGMKAARTGLCVHRVPPEEFCKRCD